MRVPDISTPFPYFGGKSQLATWILRFFPPHHRYVEVFGGSAAVLFAKPASPIEVFNDVDSGLVEFFRVLRDPALFGEFFRRVQLMPYSRQEWRDSKATWASVDDPVERAVRWYVVARWSFSGSWGTSWSYDLHEYNARGPAHIAKWLGVLDELPRFHHRLARVFIEHDDFRAILARFDGADTLYYCDPPYVPETRTASRYLHELTLGDHRELVDQLLTVEGMVVLSGYANKSYGVLESAGWRRIDKDVPLRSKNHRLTAGERRRESLWLNPACQARQVQMSLWEVTNEESTLGAPGAYERQPLADHHQNRPVSQKPPVQNMD